MTTADRIEKAQKHLAETVTVAHHQTEIRIQSLIKLCAQLVLICRNQQDEIDTLKEESRYRSGDISYTKQ